MLPTLQNELRSLASPETARILQRFFKTAPGEYGAGDQFLGIKVPRLRALAKKYRALLLPDMQQLLNSPWHEERLCALLLLMQFYERAGDSDRQAVYELYLANTKQINNWDLVDVSAPHIVGVHLQNRPRNVLYELASSSSLWRRRIAIIATFHFIRRDDFSDTLHIAERLLDDPHDLIHKATGWMLREIGKRDLPVAESFLQAHHSSMPRTMLRYAIERFPEPLRQRYLQGNVPE